MDCLRSLGCKPGFRKLNPGYALDLPPADGEIRIIGWQCPDAMEMVGEDYGEEITAARDEVTSVANHDIAHSVVGCKEIPGFARV